VLKGYKSQRIFDAMELKRIREKLPTNLHTIFDETILLFFEDYKEKHPATNKPIPTRDQLVAMFERLHP
jgi:hypothetical protein